MGATNVIRNLIEKSGELYWHDLAESDFENDDEMWTALALETDARRAMIDEAAGQFPDLLGGLKPPRSFVDCAANFGHFDLFDGQGDGLLYSFSWVESNLTHGGDLTEMLFSIPPGWLGKHADGTRIAGMCMPDDPGDMPMYMLIAAFDLRTGSDECLWLFRGGDCVWEDGLELVPIGSTYQEVVAMILSGLAAALFLPPEECERALQKIMDTGDRELAKSLLAGQSQLCEACADLELVARGVDGEITLSDQLTKLRPRIAHTAEVLGGLGDLPFGRGPVEVTRQRVEAKSREERFAESNPRSAALIEAATSGELETVRQLLDQGVNPDAVDSDGNSSLMYAANSLDYGRLETAKLLLDRGADPTIVGKFGNTALHYAAGTAQAEFVRRLIAEGADVNALDKAGSPPTLNAIENQHTDVLRVLLEAGADPNIKNENGWKALDLAEGFGTPEAVALLKKHGATGHEE